MKAAPINQTSLYALKNCHKAIGRVLLSPVKFCLPKSPCGSGLKPWAVQLSGFADSRLLILLSLAG